MIKKICFFTTHFDFVRQRYVNYYEKIFADKFECFLFCWKRDKDKFKTNKIKKVSYSCNKFYAPFKLRKFCKENKIDVLINLSGAAKMSMNLSIATVFTKTKNVFYHTGNPTFYKSDSIFFFTQFFIDRILVSAKDITKKVKKYLFISKNKIFDLPLTVDTSVYKPKNKKTSRKKLGFKQDEKIIIYVGRISYLKGSDLMLSLIKNNPDKKFLLIGELMDKDYDVPNLKNLVTLVVRDENKLVDYYNSADLCIFLSRIEGFGLVPREAMACEIPTIVSNIDSLRLISTAIKSDLDAKDAQEKIDAFFNISKNKIDKMKKESRKFIIEECSTENISLRKKYLKYFTEFSSL